jgi:hypothetical protein
MVGEGKGYEGVDLIELAQEKVEWRDSVNMVIKFRLP